MPSNLREEARATFRKVTVAIVVTVLLSYLLSMAVGLLLFYGSPQGVEAASKFVAELPLSVFMIANFSIPMGAHVGVFFLAIWVLYVLAFFLAWSDAPGLPVSLRKAVDEASMTRSNYLFVLPQVATMVLVAIVLLQSLQESAGVQTGGLSFENPVLGFLSVSYAPFVEELSFRITTIGLLDGLYFMWKTRRHSQYEGTKSALRLLVIALWKPERAKELLGFRTIRDCGVRGISRLEWVTLFFTSGAFGAAHYLYGGGWEIGKISTAMLSGLALGYVYLRYGAYAPVLLHWFFNYYFGAFDLASQLKLPGADTLATAIDLLSFGAGTIFAAGLVATYLARVDLLRRRRPIVERAYVGDSPNVS
ncbi:MAG: CPBP family intramembrane glutamic endopeptidase [Candidatus Bathyarchaeia archaeon]